MYIFAIIMFKKRKKERGRILQEFFGTDNLEDVPDYFHQVNAVSSSTFHKLIKWLPWWDPGWLISKRNEIILLHSHKGDIREVRYPRRDILIEWEGILIRNGLISWFRIQYGEEEIHLTSEPGVTVIGSKGSTKRIYDPVKLRS